jgi:hypothetical protein
MPLGSSGDIAARPRHADPPPCQRIEAELHQRQQQRARIVSLRQRGAQPLMQSRPPRLARSMASCELPWPTSTKLAWLDPARCLFRPRKCRTGAGNGTERGRTPTSSECAHGLRPLQVNEPTSSRRARPARPDRQLKTDYLFLPTFFEPCRSRPSRVSAAGSFKL